jgi:hypothetical protein
MTENPGKSESLSFEVKGSEVPFASNGLDAPTIYAEDIKGLAVINGMVKMNLVEARMNVETSQATHRHIATLVVPLAFAKNWGPFLTTHLADQSAGKDDG